jgi:hypothetical protein
LIEFKKKNYFISKLKSKKKFFYKNIFSFFIFFLNNFYKALINFYKTKFKSERIHYLILKYIYIFNFIALIFN